MHCSGRTCSAVDLVFVVGVSQRDFYLRYALPFLITVSHRVSQGDSHYQFAVVSFSDRAPLTVKLGQSEFPGFVDAAGRKTNLREALFVARTRAFGVDNGARPLAYKAAVVLWDGRTPDPEFGTLADEAPRLQMMIGADVYVVVSSTFESTSRSLVEAIASRPYSAHTWSISSNTIETVAVNILLDIRLNCQRSLASSRSHAAEYHVPSSSPVSPTPLGSTPSSVDRPRPAAAELPSLSRSKRTADTTQTPSAAPVLAAATVAHTTPAGNTTGGGMDLCSTGSKVHKFKELCTF